MEEVTQTSSEAVDAVLSIPTDVAPPAPTEDNAPLETARPSDFTEAPEDDAGEHADEQPAADERPEELVVDGIKFADQASADVYRKRNAGKDEGFRQKSEELKRLRALVKGETAEQSAQLAAQPTTVAPVGQSQDEFDRFNQYINRLAAVGQTQQQQQEAAVAAENAIRQAPPEMQPVLRENYLLKSQIANTNNRIGQLERQFGQTQAQQRQKEEQNYLTWLKTNAAAEVQGTLKEYPEFSDDEHGLLADLAINASLDTFNRKTGLPDVSAGQVLKQLLDIGVSIAEARNKKLADEQRKKNRGPTVQLGGKARNVTAESAADFDLLADVPISRERGVRTL